MAEPSCSTQGQDPSDKENAPHSLRDKRRDPTSAIPAPLQESQSCNVAVNSPESTREVSGPLNAGRARLSDWLTEHGKKVQEKNKEKPQNQNVKKTPKRKKLQAAAQGAEAAGEGHQSKLRKCTEQSHPSPGDEVKETLNKQESMKEEPLTRTQAPSSPSACLKFRWIGRKTAEFIEINVDPRDSIINGLKNSIYFKREYKPPKYLSIYAHKLHAMINPSVPCGVLRADEELELRHSKAPDIPDTPTYRCDTGGIFIKVNTRGNTEGGATRVILHDNDSNPDNIPMAVFGYEGETFENALHNDKRFIDINVLSLKGPQSKYESNVRLSQLLPNDTYTVIVSSDTKPAEDVNSPSTSTAPNCDPSPELPSTELDSYRKLEKTFIDQFNEFVKTQKGVKRTWEVIKRDFSYNIFQNRPITAHMIQTLAEYCNHVAWLRVKDNNGTVVNLGTFFILTGSLGLTCYHVVRNALIFAGYRIEISFNYNQIQVEGQYLPAEIVSYSEPYDYAFLRVTQRPIPGGPGGLLQHLALPPQHGAVAIIGHPGNNCKYVDICSVVNFNDRENSISNHPSFVHVLGMDHFIKMLHPKLLSYKTGLYEGASGAPVFNEHGQLVAMHTGGYAVKTPQKTESVIEYGRSAIEIIVMGALEIEDLRCEFSKLVQKNEALYSYMSSSSHALHMEKFIPSLRNLQ